MTDCFTYTFSNNNEIIVNAEEIIFKTAFRNFISRKPKAIMYGNKPIEIYEFTVGYNYLIQVLTEKSEKISLGFKTYFGIDKSLKFKSFNEAFNTIWDHHMIHVYNELLNDFNRGSILDFSNQYELSQGGLRVKSKDIKFDFEEIQLEKRFDHFKINSKNSPNKFTNVYYLNTWNAEILRMILESIIEQNQTP